MEIGGIDIRELASLVLNAARASAQLIFRHCAERREDRLLGIAPTQPVGTVCTLIAPLPLGPRGGVYRDSTGYEAISYRRLRAVAEHLGLASADVFVDVGCGRGRAVCFMAARGPRKAVGVEIDAELLREARANALAAARPLGTAIEIVAGDAAALPPALLDEATILFLFNPFGFRTLKALVDGLRESLRRRPRAISVVYLTATHRWYLDDQPWLIENAALRDEHGVMIWRGRPDYDYSRAV